ncbi:SCO family protein [Roseospira visakhapatnamensis]|uniref:Protein SCO1/2 n=1 Tax=Roseospira visakhapatnamensis TaxID=390880 RepID=A0A7W6REY2_9PROT|nr:SCO family protein [Roseospira visakhapatnamensis]MBB4267218.1 protein SCO1/2 [Roseospira visakhapatnamensis]
MTRTLPTLLAVVAVVALVLAIGLLPRLEHLIGTQGEDSGHGVTGTLADATGIGGPFTLVTGDGETITESSFPGQYLLLYFGYTYCPDVCPSSLSAMDLALRDLDPALLNAVQPLFITVDPERDTPEIVADYAGAFHPKLIGLTGTPEQVAAAVRAYQVHVERVDMPDSAVGYLIDHSAFLYLMRPDGTLAAFFRHGDAPEAITAGLRAALDEKANDR